MDGLSPDLSSRLARPLRLLALGEEILRGDITDTNSPWLAARLGALGWPPDAMAQAGDGRGDAEAAARRWREEGGCLVIGGGLGPTPDDATREELAAGLGVPLVECEAARAWIDARAERGGRRYGAHTYRQALLPEGAVPLPNPAGTAPGILVAGSPEGFLLVLPGVPAEYRAIAGACFALPEDAARAAVWILAGPGEDRLADILADFPGRERIGFYPEMGVNRLRLPLDGSLDLSELSARLEPWLVSRDGWPLEAVILAALRAAGQRLALAESCTGGLLGARLTAVPGASDALAGGVIAYADAVKTEALGVDPALIAREGAVSEAVALAMAAGARDRLRADWGLSVTGIAGPGGERPGKPVGTIHVALAGPGGLLLHEAIRGLWGREGNRAFAVQRALAMLWRALAGRP